MNLADQLRSLKGQLPSLEEREFDLYQRHFELLQSWNERMNLVSRKSIESAYAIHYADSLFISHFARSFVQKTLSDFGTGAGFPGIVFAIRYPEIAVRLYERSLKKRSFLSVAVTQLELANVEVLETPPAAPEPTTYLARAVLPPEELVDFFAKQLDGGGQFVLNVGSQAEFPTRKEFIRKVDTLYTLPGDFGSRKAALYVRVPRGTK